MPDWLMIRPCFDEATQFTFEEGQDVLDYFEKHSVEYIDLAKEDAVRDKVQQVLKEYPYIDVLHYDHGNETSWIDNEEKACVSSKDADCLANRQCYCNNCSSAKSLGVEAWKRGATYWGYDAVFVFTTDAQEEFKQFVNNGIKRRVDGHSWKKCIELTGELANRLVDALVKAGKALAASCLRWDRDHLVCYTEDMPPEESDCPLRNLALKTFGTKIGWQLSETFPITVVMFFVGYMLVLWDHYETILLAGDTPYRFHHGWLGLFLLLLAFMSGFYRIWNILKKQQKREK